MLRKQDKIRSLIHAAREGRLEARKSNGCYEVVYSKGWSEGYVLLIDAVKDKDAERVKLLLDRGCKVNTKYDDCSDTPLHFAARNGDVEIVLMLLHKHAEIDAKNPCGDTPLSIAVKNNVFEVTELLLKHGADVNSINKDGISPLHLAVNKGCLEMINVVLEHASNIDIEGKEGNTILHCAVKNGQVKIVENILKYCPDIHNQSNRNSLKIAVNGYGEQYEKIVGALLDYGVIIDPEDANNVELFYASLAKGYVKIVEKLLRYGADVNMLNNSTSNEDFTPLHCAARNKQEEATKLLISYGALINVKDNTGKTPIFYATENADFKVTQLLLTNGANVKDDPELLNTAVMKGSIEIVTAFFQYGADVNACDKYGRTALHFTALSAQDCVFGYIFEGNHEEFPKGDIATMLLGKGANVDCQTKIGVSTLHGAIQKGYVNVVEALLKYNANVNFRGKSNITPLHLSAQNGNKVISTMLLNRGANMNAKQKNGCTALHIATENGHKDVVKLLLQYGVEVDSIMKGDIIPLRVKAPKSYQKIPCFMNFLPCNNSNNGFSRTALCIASQKGHEKVVETLLDYGADVNVTGTNNHTPLEAAMAIYVHYSDYNRDPGSYKLVVETLIRHLVIMKTADLYISENNLLSMNSYQEKEHSEHFGNFQNRCEEEIARMKSSRLSANVSYYDILAKGKNSLAVYMKNVNTVQILRSVSYKNDFPLYARMINRNFRKGIERKELLEQSNNIFHSFFNLNTELPYVCTERILSYLRNKDLRILMDAYKTCSISCSNAND